MEGRPVAAAELSTEPPAAELPVVDVPENGVLNAGVAERKALNVKFRTVGHRAERAAARLYPAETDSACCDCNCWFTCSAIAQASWRFSARAIPGVAARQKTTMGAVASHPFIIAPILPPRLINLCHCDLPGRSREFPIVLTGTRSGWSQGCHRRIEIPRMTTRAPSTLAPYQLKRSCRLCLTLSRSPGANLRAACITPRPRVRSGRHHSQWAR